MQPNIGVPKYIMQNNADINGHEKKSKFNDSNRAVLTVDCSI
jgi:hypothetical protein